VCDGKVLKMVHVATSVGCVLYRGCDRELVWGSARDTKGHEQLRINANTERTVNT